jgi:hypothetical protein
VLLYAHRGSINKSVIYSEQMVKTKTKKVPIKSKTVPKKRVAAARTAKAPSVVQEMDGVYLLKLVLYLIIGSQWVRVTRGGTTIPIPIGVIIGYFFARSERFQIDRKLEFAVLLMAMFISFWVLPGIEILF